MNNTVAKRVAQAVAGGFALALLLAHNAQAQTAGGWIQENHVEDAVTDLGGGTWSYQYTVFNDSTFSCSGDPGTCQLEIFPSTAVPIIVDWELPYYADMGITNVTSPVGWDWAIETIGMANPITGWTGVASWMNPGDPWYAMFGPDSPFGVNNLTQVLHWYVPGADMACGFGPAAADALIDASGTAIALPTCPGIAPAGSQGAFPFPLPDGFAYDTSLAGFGFDASFDATAAPYQASWINAQLQSGDPAFPFGGLPASPSVTGGAAPLPAVPALLALGLLVMAARMRNKIA